MAPASRSKSKEKRATGKEPQKASGKPIANANANAGVGVPTSGYNPLLGTFHALETSPTSSAPPIHVNGRFRSIDETDDRSGAVEYDTVSNNGSWSGESEEQKDKTSQGPSRQEVVPGTDSDKREKIRQKNEKKHQRQKERRAQELHERCSGYLMSRKLEALAQQLVAMGFSSERATMALILNEGRVEESVAWLFEGGEDAEDQREHSLENGDNLKIDISEELARISEMEIKFKCSKQEVERAIVACEGDLEQAAETLRVQKQDPPIPPKPDETGDPPIVTSNGKVSAAVSQNSLIMSTQSKPSPSGGAMPVQQKRDDKDLTYARPAMTVGPPTEPGIKNMQLLKKVQPKLEWAKQQFVTSSAEKRWPVTGSNASVSYSPASPLQASSLPSKAEARSVNVGNELKNLQLGSVREPVIMMQRPQPKQIPTTSISSSTSSSSQVADWHSNGNVEPVMNMKHDGLSHIPTSTRSFSPPSYGGHLYNQFHYQQQQQQPHLQQQQQQQFLLTGGQFDHHPHLPGSTNHGNNGLWNRTAGTATSPTLAAASSLGLFAGFGSNGGTGPTAVDWSAGGTILQLDYSNIDWSLDRVPLQPSSSSSQNGMWTNFGSSSSTDLYASGRSPKPRTDILSNGNNGVSVGGIGMHPDGVGVLSASETSAGGSREWSSPFEERDLFSLPRQFVSSPSL